MILPRYVVFTQYLARRAVSACPFGHYSSGVQNLRAAVLVGFQQTAEELTVGGFYTVSF